MIYASSLHTGHKSSDDNKIVRNPSALTFHYIDDLIDLFTTAIVDCYRLLGLLFELDPSYTLQVGIRSYAFSTGARRQRDMLDCVSILTSSLMLDEAVIKTASRVFKDNHILLHTLTEDFVDLLEALQEMVKYSFHPSLLELLSVLCVCEGIGIAKNQDYILNNFLPIILKRGFRSTLSGVEIKITRKGEFSCIRR